MGDLELRLLGSACRGDLERRAGDLRLWPGEVRLGEARRAGSTGRLDASATGRRAGGERREGELRLAAAALAGLLWTILSGLAGDLRLGDLLLRRGDLDLLFVAGDLDLRRGDLDRLRLPGLLLRSVRREGLLREEA